MDKSMLTVADLQKLWGISRPTTYELVNSEGFPTLRIGRKILIPQKQLEVWVEEHLGEVVLPDATN